MKILKSSVNKVLNPVKGIFQRIFSFFFSILAGRFLIKLLNFFSNPKNSGVVNAIGNFISGNFPLILGGVVAAGLGLLTLSTALTTATGIVRAAQLLLGLGGPITGAGEGILKRFRGTGVDKATKGIVARQFLTKIFLRRGTGGIVPGSGSNDTVPAMLTPGEVVISKPAAQKFGVSNLLAINAAAGAKSIPKIKRGRVFANQGMVVPDISMPNLAEGGDGIDLTGMVDKFGGLGGGGGGTDSITDKAKTKSLGKKIKDVGKILTFPFHKRRKDPTEKFASEQVMAAPTNSMGGGAIAGSVEAGDNPPVRKKKPPMLRRKTYAKGGVRSRKPWLDYLKNK